MSTTHSQDTSSQAMTEVALGLSMAFFALLILALFSMGVPNQAPIEALTMSEQSHQSSEQEAQDDAQFVFYHKGKFFDKQLKPLALEHINPTAPVYLVVANNMPFADILTLRRQINHPKLSITPITEQWQTRLEQLP